MATTEVKHADGAPSNSAMAGDKGLKLARVDGNLPPNSPSIGNSRQVKHRESNTGPQNGQRAHTGAITATLSAVAPESTPSSDSTIVNRHVTSKPSNGNGLQGALHADSTHKRGLRPPWKPGESGNPKGRPPGGSSDAKALAKEFGEGCADRTGRTRDDKFLSLLYRRGMQGNMKAAELWAGYRWGKPTQAVELDAKVDFTDALTRIRERERQRQLGAPVATPEPTNGHADTITAAEAITVHDVAKSLVGVEAEEQPEDTPRPRIRVEL